MNLKVNRNAGNLAAAVGISAVLTAGCNAYLAREVKESGEIHIPVLTLGAFQQPEPSPRFFPGRASSTRFP